MIGNQRSVRAEDLRDLCAPSFKLVLGCGELSLRKGTKRITELPEGDVDAKRVKLGMKPSGTGTLRRVQKLLRECSLSSSGRPTDHDHAHTTAFGLPPCGRHLLERFFSSI